MLRQDEVEMALGRCEGGSFIRVTHLPTGVSRYKGPLGGESTESVTARFGHEIEQELIAKGLLQYIVPAYRERRRNI
jgi:hypothetical protein